MINVLEGAERGPAVRSMSMILCRRRRQCLPGDGPWYVVEKSIDPHDATTVVHEIKNTAVDVLPDGEDDPKIIQVLTRIKMVELDAVSGKAAFAQWCETRYAHLPNFSSTTASKLFDLITFVIQVCVLVHLNCPIVRASGRVLSLAPQRRRSWPMLQTRMRR